MSGVTAQNLAVRFANVTRILAKARQQLLVLAQAGYFLKVDGACYEVVRQASLQLRARCNAAGGLRGAFVAAPISAAVLQRAQNGEPSLVSLTVVSRYAMQLRADFNQLPATDDPLERAFRGLENEARVVLFYVQERLCAHGLGEMSVNAGLRKLLARVQTTLSLPQVQRVFLDAGLVALSGAASVMSGRPGTIPVLVPQGANLAGLGGVGRPHVSHVSEARSGHVTHVGSPTTPAVQPKPVETQAVACDVVTQECTDSSGKPISPEALN